MMKYLLPLAISAAVLASSGQAMAAPKCPGMIPAMGGECIHKDYEINPKHYPNRVKKPSKPAKKLVSPGIGGGPHVTKETR
jgi:hypothetical protein